ncbi:MAG: hypothetical protein DRJ26_03895 [Candidatus Methanomethylicota archaeon]|uniref:SnoaL-like domain-containing protein n=1 Tax=Thermoproteota archaeon TaxID=2056631 RepID=A0A497EWN3_9CREN|nr:MAG: hypothetical protein DRJ20_01835 [Candidatus Verstraetearchaeota archaeon]RLE53056.1 MAG: hypothetical protein DRJ26_03895 [Candidatus Verstraetearchaeota archaeon]
MLVKWVEGLRIGGVEAINALYTEDAIQLPPKREIIRGREKIKEVHTEAVQMGFENSILTERGICKRRHSLRGRQLH